MLRPFRIFDTAAQFIAATSDGPAA